MFTGSSCYPISPRKDQTGDGSEHHVSNDDQLVKIFEKFNVLDEEDFGFISHERVKSYCFQIYNQIDESNSIQSFYNYASPQLVSLLKDML